MADINTVCLTGKLIKINANNTKGEYPVVEAKLIVNNGEYKGDIQYSSISVRSYGKKSLYLATLEEGSLVTIEGMLKEDIRVNSLDPSTVRSKIYVNINKIKVLSKKEKTDVNL